MGRTRMGRTDGRTDGQTDGLTDGRTDGQGDDYMLPRNFSGSIKKPVYFFDKKYKCVCFIVHYTGLT